jgi:hypothetical protein
MVTYVHQIASDALRILAELEFRSARRIKNEPSWRMRKTDIIRIYTAVSARLSERCFFMARIPIEFTSLIALKILKILKILRMGVHARRSAHPQFRRK